MPGPAGSCCGAARTGTARWTGGVYRQGLLHSNPENTSKNILNNAHSRAFLYTETDQNDLTYFLIYQLEVLGRAIKELHAYLARKMAEVRNAEALLRQSPDLNYRQLALLGHAMRNSDARYTITSHRTSHNIAYETARSDLLSLEKRGFLNKQKRGRAFYFTPAPELIDKLSR